MEDVKTKYELRINFMDLRFQLRNVFVLRDCIPITVYELREQIRKTEETYQNKFYNSIRSFK